jgi:selenocysteine-specific elongation factor
VSLPIRIGRRPVDIDLLLARAKRTLVRVGARLFDADVAKTTELKCLATIRLAHEQHPLEPGLPVQAIRSSVHVAAELVDACIARLVEAGKITVAGGLAARAGWTAGGGDADSQRSAAVLAALKAAGPRPPSLDELAATHGKDVFAILKMLVRRGDLIAVASDRYFSRESVDQLVSTVEVALAGGAELTASQLREAIGVTRKYLIPFLEYCDRQGITLRKGDGRVLGAPRKP